MALIKFLRGLEANYAASSYKDGIYFATDTGHIYLNGVLYGGSSEIKVSDAIVENSTLKITYTDGDVKEFDLINLIAKASDTSDGLMSSEDKAIVDEVFANLNSGMAFISSDQARIIAEVKDGKYTKVEGVTTADNILSLGDDKLLSAKISLSYDDVNKKITLLGKDDAELGSVDASSFIKDGMLEDVTIVEATETDPVGEYTSGKFIYFTWKILDGETKTNFIAVSDFVSDYISGNGITIDNNVVKVKVYESDPYLTVDVDGIKTKGIDDAIASAVADIPTQISTAKSEAISAVKGNAIDYDTLGKVETKLDAIDNTIASLDSTAVKSVSGSTYIDVTGDKAAIVAAKTGTMDYAANTVTDGLATTTVVKTYVDSAFAWEHFE